MRVFQHSAHTFLQKGELEVFNLLLLSFCSENAHLFKRVVSKNGIITVAVISREDTHTRTHTKQCLLTTLEPKLAHLASTMKEKNSLLFSCFISSSLAAIPLCFPLISRVFAPAPGCPQSGLRKTLVGVRKGKISFYIGRCS